MPTQNTEVKSNLSHFEQAMEGAQFQSEEAREAHALMLQTMKNLVQETDRFYEKKDGVYPKMTEESFDHFTALYRDVLKGSDEYRKIMSGLTGEDKETGRAMDQIMEPILDMLGKDLNTLSSAKEKGLTTLPEIVERARIRVVDISGQKLDRAGENMSERLKVSVPGQDGKGKMTGFFTEAVSGEYEKEYQEILDRAIAKNPDIEVILGVMRQKQFEQVQDSIEKMKVVAWGGELRNDGEEEIYISPDHVLDEYVVITEDEKSDWNALVEGTGVVQDFVDFAKEAAALRQKYGVFEDSGIQENKDVARRNSAMTSVADLLGMGSLIARSESMKLKDGDKQYQGNFMEPAIGADAKHCKPGDPLLRAGVQLDVESDEVKKQLSDLQVLDYICGNVDRHGGNLFYQIDDRDPAHPRLTGIQGIDNDCSFGTLQEGRMRLPKSSGIVAISESTARMVSCLDETVMKTLLRQYNFSDAELDAVWKRTQNLQKSIQDGYEFYKANPGERLSSQHPRVIKDSQWSDFSMQELADANSRRGSYFNRATEIQDSAMQDLLYSEFDQAVEKQRNDFVAYGKQGTGLHQLNDQLKKQNKGLFTGSRQYDRVMEQAGNLERMHAESMKNPSSESIRQMMEEYKKTIQAAQEYLDYKQDAFEKKVSGKSMSKRQKELEKFMDPNGRDFKRMAAASELISEVEKYQKQAEAMLKSREQYKEKETLLFANKDKKEEYLKQLEAREQKKERVGAESGRRVLMSRDELFGESAGQKSRTERLRDKECKAPEKTSTGMSRSK